MLLSKSQLKKLLEGILKNRHAQGHDTAAAVKDLASLPDSYDAIMAFAERVPTLPMRSDWTYQQPEAWQKIVAAMDPARTPDPIALISLEEAAARVEAGFFASVCGCQLGKPLEISPTLAELKTAFTNIGEWPITQYVSERIFDEGKLRTRHASWNETTREHLRYAAADDDINYTVLGMMVLEQHGLDFTAGHLCSIWLKNQAPMQTWGPERTILIKAGSESFFRQAAPVDEEMIDRWTRVFNLGDELCGAMIRADAYGYACPGRPMLAAELAWKDAHLTHRLTGVYGTMFAAAAIAVAFVERDPVRVFEIALQYVPQQSHFAHVIRESIPLVRAAKSWEEGYNAIHARFGRWGHCEVYQESATLINTLKFAKDVGDGICIQVMQGNDTDSYGATAGSILGCFFGPGHLEERWVKPLNNRLHTTLADFHEQTISAVAKRMAKLPGLTLVPSPGNP